jgi:hypothetical protein
MAIEGVLFLKQLVHRCRDLAAMIQTAVADDAFAIQDLVLLCYVESAKTSSNFRPQQWQKPIHRSNHGRIRLSVCSHVTPEVFFGAQVDDGDKQIRQDGQDQVVMKPAPTAPLEMIQAQIGLSPLEILFDVPA